jgi:hypothetical protein
MSDPLLGKHFLEDEIDGGYNTGEIIDNIGTHYIVRYDPGDRTPAPLAVIGLEELASVLPSGARKFHWLKARKR